MKLKSVHVIGPTFGAEFMFAERGYKAFTDKTIGTHKPDILCFMGGTDISPSLYGEKPWASTQPPNKARDQREVELWHKNKGVPKIGVCRGAQLINVLNGGKLIQHVHGHEYGNHLVTDIKGIKHKVCSVHHQMIIPSSNAKLIAWTSIYGEQDPEVLFIPDDKALLFQGHPEFGPAECTDYFFELVEEYLQNA